MARTCTVCARPDCLDINKALVDSHSLRNISKRFDIRVSSLHRHKRHLGAQIMEAKRTNQAMDLGTVIDHLLSLRLETLEVLHAAKNSKDSRTMLAAIGRAEAQLRLSAELIGGLQSRLQVQVRVIHSLRDLTDEELAACIQEGERLAQHGLLVPVIPGQPEAL